MNWAELDHATEDAIWERFESQFLFRPGIKASDGPRFLQPIPSVTYSLSTLFRSDGEVFQQHVTEIHRKILGAFRACVPPTQRMYALDWQHKCYWFSPHNQNNADEPASWPISIYPNGDYHIFLTEDFSTGTFGHPWRETICVFGERLMELVQNDLPEAFRELRHKP